MVGLLDLRVQGMYAYSAGTVTEMMNGRRTGGAYTEVALVSGNSDSRNNGGLCVSSRQSASSPFAKASEGRYAVVHPAG
jgi:hypothetical protein